MKVLASTHYSISEFNIPHYRMEAQRGGVPLPTGSGVWGGSCAPSPENFWTFYLEIALFGAF